jgi:hypothetical protein
MLRLRQLTIFQKNHFNALGNYRVVENVPVSNETNQLPLFITTGKLFTICAAQICSALFHISTFPGQY